MPLPVIGIVVHLAIINVLSLYTIPPIRCPRGSGTGGEPAPAESRLQRQHDHSGSSSASASEALLLAEGMPAAERAQLELQQEREQPAAA